MKFYDVDARFTFGKYEGLSLAEVFAKDPKYIDYCSNNIDEFYVSKAVLKELKAGTLNQSSDDDFDKEDEQFSEEDLDGLSDDTIEEDFDWEEDLDIADDDFDDDFDIGFDEEDEDDF